MTNAEVIWLNVPVDDSITMKIRNSFKDIAKNEQNLIIEKMFPFLDKTKKVVVRTVLHDEIRIFLIVKHAIKLNNVWMIQVELNLYLSH